MFFAPEQIHSTEPVLTGVSIAIAKLPWEKRTKKEASINPGVKTKRNWSKSQTQYLYLQTWEGLHYIVLPQKHMENHRKQKASKSFNLRPNRPGHGLSPLPYVSGFLLIQIWSIICSHIYNCINMPSKLGRFMIILINPTPLNIFRSVFICVVVYFLILSRAQLCDVLFWVSLGEFSTPRLCCFTIIRS